ncbi:MAG: ABC transporter ATP-binding protein [Thiobacillus sp. 63-78]|uniref:ABC transporter ATP-binding protein n=1 Tax=Thiobacillus sp. 63-78 TaxID=1895859 RepID=UPI000965AC3F|nr:ABC transporter ATP-binding protein [Thiobacillus sp. 63-78]MBN8762976.1 ABC transporter ATP-binding protein [Thiobacillus sp.]MBN8773535.1 ABC transporter ATP-binding protein [Thiobacillus sp.]OJZ11407.1 MAG: ABC transporter ATP-binding protein [Thiobacillus sp. 63-78]
MKPLLRVDTLITKIGAARVVDGVSFRVEAGETYALLGESGCGKSITALSLMRLLPDGGRIVSGAVRLGDTDVLALPEREMRRVRGGRMAMVFQEPMLALNPVIRVGDQIGEALSLHQGLAGAAAREAARALLDSVGVPDAARRLDTYPFELSGGLRQRMMIAMALAGEPELLIADEPTTALDVTIQAQVLGVLRDLRATRRMGMLLITHDLGVVAENADRVGVMYAGELLEEGARDAFFTAPQHPYSRMLFEALPRTGDGGRLATIAGQVPRLDAPLPGCRFAPRCPFAIARCREESPGWRELGGMRVRCHRAGELPTDSVRERIAHSATAHVPQTLLQVEGLKMYFPIRRGVIPRTVGYVRAVDGVDLAVQAGRTLALVGESGCGKTTVGKALLRLIEPTAGTIMLGGETVAAKRMPALRRQAQMVFQDPFSSLNPRMRVADILLEGMEALGVDTRGKRRGAVARLLSQVGLPDDAGDRYPHAFSGGQRQRIAIARALAVSPRLVICDEPTSALDVSVQAQILNLLKDLQDDLGLAYLFITHNLAVVEYLAHEVAVMYLGRIVEQGPAGAVLHTPRHPYTQALVGALPRIEPHAGRRIIRLAGDQPSPLNPPAGCHFHPRCPHASAICRQTYPQQTDLGGGHWVRCHWVAEQGKDFPG